MTTTKLQWSNLLKLTELDFRPDFPAQLSISDEVLQVISWLTATTGFDCRLLRCTPQGALLVAKPWTMMHMVETHVLFPQTVDSDITDALAANDGVLITTSTQIVLITFRRVEGGAMEKVYVPPGRYYWFPFSCYTVAASVVPAGTGTDNYVGVTVYKS